MEMSSLLTVAGIVFAYSLMSRHLERRAITAPMVFVAAGWIIGPDGLNLIGVGFEGSAARLLAEATLVLVLFADATRVHLGVARKQFDMPGRLLAIGLPLTIAGGGALAAWLVPGVTPAEGFVIGAILAPTDAALGKGVVANKAIPVRVRQILNVESGLNDGIALPAVTALVAVAAAGTDLETPAYWARFALREISSGVVMGIAIGAAGGALLRAAWNRGWVTPAARQLATLAIAAAAYAATEAAAGNGFIAAFVAGMAFRATAKEMHEAAADLTEDLGELATWMTFLFFGVALVVPALRAATAGTVLYVLLSLTIVRMIPVGLALLGTHCARSTTVFIGWFGPRGLASILFALLIIDEADLAGQTRILDTVALAVLLSVFLHGISARRGGALYAARAARMPETMPEMRPVDEMPAPRRGGSSDLADWDK